MGEAGRGPLFHCTILFTDHLPRHFRGVHPVWFWVLINNIHLPATHLHKNKSLDYDSPDSYFARQIKFVASNSQKTTCKSKT